MAMRSLIKVFPIILLTVMTLSAATHSGWSGFFSLPGKPETAVEAPAVQAGPSMEFTAFPCVNGIAFTYAIPFSAAPSPLTLTIYDVSGRLIRTFSLGADRQSQVVWDLKGSNNRRAGAGVYAARLRMDGLNAAKSFVVF